MKLFSSQRFLAIYSGVLSVVFVTTVFGGLTAKRHRFDEIDVHRINVVEADGTPRMVLSNKTRLPGIIVKGKEYAHEDRKTAGILFFDDEGTENGGLIFGGMRGKDGKVESWGHLSFDQYMQDQVFTVDAGEENGQRRSGIVGADQCTDSAIQQSQKQTLIAAPEYAKQIGLARRATLEIYDHGFLGNSDSAINHKVGRPPGMSVAVGVDGKLVWAEGFGLADLEQCVPNTRTISGSSRFREALAF
jgi:hypothetical protein